MRSFLQVFKNYYGGGWHRDDWTIPNTSC